MTTNIIKIAQIAGVSTATVSRALNKNGSVRKETSRRIVQIAQDLNYRPNTIARSLSLKRTDTIGVILPELVDEFFTEIIRGIDEEAYRNNQYIMVSSSHSQRNIVETLLEFMGTGRVDGVILMAPQLQNESAELVRKSKRPVVLVNVCREFDGVVSLNIDNYQGASSIVEHLVWHGYKKIAMIKGPDGNCDAEERFRGYRDTLLKHDLEIDDNFVVQGNFTVKSGYYGFSRLMGQVEKPQAIIAANDMMAVGIYEAAQETGLQIPKDIAVVGFDDIYLSRILQPRLTTVHVPISELGSTAFGYLFKMINNDVDPKQSFRKELTTGLVIGGSCGCQNTKVNNLF